MLLFSVSLENCVCFYCFCHKNIILGVLYLFFLPQPMYLGKHVLTFGFLSSRHELKKSTDPATGPSQMECALAELKNFGVPSSQDQPALLPLYHGCKMII